MRKLFAGLVMALLALGASAQDQSPTQTKIQSNDRFARQWPLQLARPDAGAYRLTLDAAVYTAARQRDLRDVQVIAADGKFVASAIYPAAPLAPRQHTVTIPWFALPTALVKDDGDWSVAVQRNTSGDVVSIRSTAKDATTDSEGGPPSAWLLDRGRAPGKLQSLTITWVDDSATFDLEYRLEGSDDLRQWRLLEPAIRLMQLHNNQGQTLRTNTIALDTRLRYLRLVPTRAESALVPKAFVGEVTDAITANDWQWQAVPLSGAIDQTYLYRLEGRFPIRRLDVVMPANSTARWTVSSRDPDQSAAPSTAPAWHVRISGWNAWNLSDGGNNAHSVPWVLSTTVSDRAWQLAAAPDAALSAAPQLRAGYRPGHLVFLAQGKAPYLLVAGSAGPVPTHAALDPMLDALRARNGTSWQPPAATLGPGSERAGASAYQSAPVPRDWKNILLWAVLVLGALVVAGFALSLIRGTGRKPGAS